jgi:cell division protein FtsL
MLGSRRFLLLAVPLLWVAVLVSAAGAIYCKQRTRELFMELEKLNRGRDALEAERLRLQLEQSSYATYASVEYVATQKLRMSIPASREIQMARQ